MSDPNQHRLRLPKAGVAGCDVQPWGHPVLWSIDLQPDTVDSVCRLNAKSLPDVLREQLPPRVKGRTVPCPGFVWIMFAGTPTWGTIVHEVVHAIGMILRERGAISEIDVGDEIEAYSAERLVMNIGENIARHARKT